jgi:hypothetical protein
MYRKEFISFLKIVIIFIINKYKQVYIYNVIILFLIRKRLFYVKKFKVDV